LTTSSVGIHKIQLVIGVNQGIATGFYLLKLDKTGTVLWTKLMQKKALGTIKGRPVAIGTYYYFFKIKNPTDTAFKQKSGAITLLR